MITPTLVAIALACGIGFIALMVVIGKVLGAAHRRWLEHRLHRRMARGNDSYFEELRSIETALAQHNHTPRKLSALDYALGLIFAVIVGVQFLTWTVPETERPGWTNHLSLSIFILIGVQWAIGSSNFSGTPTRGSRVMGVAMIAFFSFFLILDLSKLGGAS